jgi:hypothetical protein
MKSHGPGLSFLRIGLATLHKGERSIIEDRQPSYLDIGHITLRSETTDRFGSCSSIMEISRHQVRGRAGQPAGHLEVVGADLR